MQMSRQLLNNLPVGYTVILNGYSDASPMVWKGYTDEGYEALEEDGVINEYGDWLEHKNCRVYDLDGYIVPASELEKMAKGVARKPAKQTAANNFCLRQVKRLFNGPIYARIQERVNNGENFESVVSFLLKFAGSRERLISYLHGELTPEEYFGI